MKFLFNATAMLAPSTKDEYIALLDEALALVDQLSEMMRRSTLEIERACACDSAK